MSQASGSPANASAAGRAVDWRELNRAQWDERVAVHTGPGGYDMAALRAGTARLNAIEEAELGSIAGLRVLHLQCHFGRDSLILAQRGAAEVVGVDFSPAAIQTASALAAELGLPARFVLSDVYAAPDALDARAGFDLVYVTWGAIAWLPDIEGWARVIAHFLRPGGTLYLAEGHPAAMVFDDDAPSPNGLPGFSMPYFERAPLVTDDDRDYVDEQARLTHTMTVEWLHPLTDVLNALSTAGMRLDWLREHEAATWRMFRCLVEHEDGLFRWPDRKWLPLSYSLRAERVGEMQGE